jgi:hypothetical protein
LLDEVAWSTFYGALIAFLLVTALFVFGAI